MQRFQPALEARQGLAAQIIVQADVVGSGKPRQLGCAQLDLEAAAARDLHAVGERGGNVGEQLRHLGLRLEVLPGRKQPRAPLVGEDVALADAHARLVRLEFLGREKLHRMGRHHRQLEARGELHAAPQAGLLLRSAGALQLEVETVGKQRRPRARQQLCLRLVVGQDAPDQCRPGRRRTARSAPAYPAPGTRTSSPRPGRGADCRDRRVRATRTA